MPVHSRASVRHIIGLAPTCKEKMVEPKPESRGQFFRTYVKVAMESDCLDI
jgi:hypothetical protein